MAKPTGADYHWYKLGQTQLTADDYIYFLRSWYIQIDVFDLFWRRAPKKQYEV